MLFPVKTSNFSYKRLWNCTLLHRDILCRSRMQKCFSRCASNL